MNTFADIFTPRQLVALTTFSDLIQDAMEQVKRDATTAGLPDDDSLYAMAAMVQQLMQRRWGCTWLLL